MSDIHHINLAAIDLNLLVVFDALMSERNVTRAGKKIGLSQPATSNALARLRNLFEDDLFVRTPNGMQPTPRAINLSHPIGQVLLKIQSTLEKESVFSPEASERVFSIGMSDHGELVLLPKLMQSLEKEAPKVKIRVRSLEREAALKMIDKDELDLVIGFFPEHSSWHEEKALFQERFVGVCRKGNDKLSEQVTLEEYLGSGHLMVSPNNEDMTGFIDQILEQKNLRRHIAMSVPHFLVAPFVLADTDLIATLAERVAKTYLDILSLRIFDLPLDAGGFPVSMLWHTKNNSDLAHTWLREVVAQVCAGDC